MLLAILVIQEEILSFIPQVQLTVILIIVYARFLSGKELYPLIIGYVILDNIIMGSFNLMYTPAMFFSWLLLAFVAQKVRNKSDYVVFMVAVIFPFIYGWSFIPATAILQHFSWSQVIAYLKIDLAAEALMAANSVATYLFFYKPLNELFIKLYHPKGLDKFEIFK
ncbi:hypothetical protein RJI07_00140 [Mycoplasmatota bacterium WC30]